MSDIEDGELLSSDNEECLQPLSQKEEKKSKNKVKNYVDTNNNLQTFVNEQRNFHKNDENHRTSRRKSSNSPGSRERKRKHYHKLDLNEIKRHRRSSENKEKVEKLIKIEKLPDYNSNKKPIEIVPELIADIKKPEENVTVKRKILCKYYASGECKNGSNCLFMHEDFPCKFFHDKSSNCRAGDDCKYSHAPLADDMKTVMDSFIHEGRDHKSNFSAPSHTANVPVQNRTKCLLPTPEVEPHISQLSQTQFHKPVFYSDFCDPEPYEEPLVNNSNHFISRYSNSSMRISYPINKPRLLDQDFRQFPGNFTRKQPDFNTKNNRMPFEPSGNLYVENYRSDFYSTDMAPASPPEINFHEPPSCDIGTSQHHVTPNIPYNNHAPARFIVGNNNNASKPIVDSSMEDEVFKEALKRLADTVTLPDISSNQDSIQKSNFEEQENYSQVKLEKTNPMIYRKNNSTKPTKFVPKDKNGYKSKFITVPPGKPLQSVKKPEPIRMNSNCEENVNPSSIKQENIDYDPFQPHINDEYGPVSSNVIHDKVSYSPAQPNTSQVSYSTFTQEKVSYSPILSNIKQESVSYSPILSNIKQESVSYSPAQPDNITFNTKPETKSYSNVQQVKQSQNTIQAENDKNSIKTEAVAQNIVRIADNVSIFQINENELSESERQYIDEMRSLINLDAQFENKVPWVAVKLQPVLKQPYILFSLKVDQVHENAASDPRLVGHPVLREIETLNDLDEMSSVNDASKNPSRNIAHAENNNNDENEENNENIENSGDYLKIDLESSNQPKSPCDTRSYLYNYKVKKENISGQIML